MTTPEMLLTELAIAEDALADASLQFAAAHRHAGTSDVGMERMLTARDRLLEAVDHFDKLDLAWYTAEELSGES